MLAIILRIDIQAIRHENPCVDRKIIAYSVSTAIEAALKLNREIIVLSGRNRNHLFLELIHQPLRTRDVLLRVGPMLDLRHDPECLFR